MSILGRRGGQRTIRKVHLEFPIRFQEGPAAAGKRFPPQETQDRENKQQTEQTAND
jgi:hypothetical protein